MRSDTDGLPLVAIVPFDPKAHERSEFTCGIERLDNYLIRTAKKHQAGDFTRVWVATEQDGNTVLGYYAINAHSLEGDDLPPALTKNAPRHGGIPAVYLSMLAVDQTMQGRGLGRILLVSALRRVAGVSKDLGVAVVVLDVLEDGTEQDIEKRTRFYHDFGFIPFPSHPRRMFISVKTITQQTGS